MRALCICEKPSLMREVQSVYSKISFKDDVDFVALHGHCMTLAQPGDYKKEWEKWDKTQLPMIPEKYKYKVVDKDVVDKIKDLLKTNHYDYLINSTDAEREGQNIFYSLYSYLGLKLPVKRIWLSDLNFGPIKDAWENLRDDLNEPFLKNLTASARCRAAADWIVGMNLTRACGKRVGRVKTPTLQLLADRELAIQNFVEEISYGVQANYQEGFSGEYLPPDDIFFDTKEAANNFIKTLINKATVESYEQKETKEYAPNLHSLADLQSEANKTYGYTLKDTLEIVQSLYESKITTYPRTDCSYITSGDAKRMPEIIKKSIFSIPGYNGYIKFIKPELVKNYQDTKYANDSKVKAHGAIIFTGTPFDYDKLTSKQKDIVQLIAKRILATVLPPIINKKTKLVANIGKNKFVSNGSKNVSKGYSVLYKKEFTDVEIPSHTKGDILDVDTFNILEKKTKCPPRYNDASLIKAMINIGNTLSDKELASYLKGDTPDQGGIGTPATRAAIVESLLEEMKVYNGTEVWVERKGKSFYVTEAGLKVANILKGTSVSSAVLTAKWEEKLSNIVDGKLTIKDFLNDLYKYIHEETKTFIKLAPTSTPTLAIKCPICHSNMKESSKYFYCENYKKTCEFILSKDFCGGKLNASDAKNLCELKPTRLLKLKSKAGKKFDASLQYNLTTKKIDFIFKERKK